MDSRFHLDLGPVTQSTLGISEMGKHMPTLTLCTRKAHLCGHVMLLCYATGTFMCPQTSYNLTR